MASNSLGTVLPGSVGGDVAKAALVVRRRGTVTGSGTHLVSIAADRLIGLASVIVLGGIAGLMASNLEHRGEFIAATIVALAIMAAVLWAAVRSARGGRVVNLVKRLAGERGATLVAECLNTVAAYSRHPRLIVHAGVLCLAIHGIWFMLVYCLAEPLGVNVGFLNLCIATSMSWVVSALPISFGGLGVRELTLVFFIEMHGGSGEGAVALGLSQFLISTVVAFVGLAFFVLPNSRERLDTPVPAGETPR